MQLDLPTQLTATFTAGSVPAGVYSVVVTRGDGASATLPSAFTMDQGGAANFKTNLVSPSTLGYVTSRPRFTCGTATPATWPCRPQSST